MERELVDKERYQKAVSKNISFLLNAFLDAMRKNGISEETIGFILSDLMKVYERELSK